MTVYHHEMRLCRKMLLIWSALVGGMIMICMIMFPEMRNQMAGVSELFSSMGGFTEAFGMDQIDFGTVMGFYGIECGNVLGIGGAFFAALLGIKILSKEEADHTAEFLFSHPVSRGSVLTQKLLAIISQLVIFNIICILFSVVSFYLISEEISWEAFLLFHLAQALMQLQIACICFGLSAFIHRGNLGLGLGLAALLYFLNIIGNISDQAAFVKYLTPFKYSDPAEIIATTSIDPTLVCLGMAYAMIAVIIGYSKYLGKDLRP